LRDAGAVLIGLTTTPEFGWKAVTDSPLTGITRNAWNPALTSGGSSGGAAVAAATGAGVLHLGTDGGGSIRIPAAFNGVVGHKPSFGRVPAYPSSAFGTVAHIGPIARRVEDAMVMLDVMSRRDIRDWRQSHAAFRPTLGERAKLTNVRLGIWEQPLGGHVDTEIAQSFEAALALLSFSGTWLSPVSLPRDRARGAFDILWRSGAANRLQAIDPEQRGKIEPGFRALAEAGARYSSVDFLGAETDRAILGSAFDELLTQVDLIVSPAVAILPFEAGRETPSAAWPDWVSWAGFSYPVNLAQLPACTVPFGLSRSGLPLAIQFIGRRGDDDKVLQVARAFEAIAMESEAA
jgi:amidase/aspartyl-tRNA(Asn)/glutamyl-tRNA(Gln) amidotransferase subunit A